MSNLNKYITSHWQLELEQSIQPLGQSFSQGQAENIYEFDYSLNNNIILLIFLTIRAICMQTVVHIIDTSLGYDKSHTPVNKVDSMP